MPLNSWHTRDETMRIVATSCQDFFSLGYIHVSKLMPSEASFKELSTCQKSKFFDLKRDIECLLECRQTHAESESTYLKIKSPQISILIFLYVDLRNM